LDSIIQTTFWIIESELDKKNVERQGTQFMFVNILVKIHFIKYNLKLLKMLQLI